MHRRLALLAGVALLAPGALGLRLPAAGGPARRRASRTRLRAADAETTMRKMVEAAHKATIASRRYAVLGAAETEGLCAGLEARDPTRFTHYKTEWDKWPDGTDNIQIGGFNPTNMLAHEHVMFIASFHSNDATLSQFHVFITLLESFIGSLTIVLPYYPTGTMERVTQEGVVATANSLARLFSGLPSCGQPVRVVVYDLHTLQNRFYLHGNAIASLKTTVPLLFPVIDEHKIDCIAFPDDGAAKRFAASFDSLGLEIVVCGKVRDGDDRFVRVTDGDPKGKRVVIVDDLVQTGGTLYECGKALIEMGALDVNAFVAHGVFPKSAWRRFAKGGDRAVFSKFWLTDSIPTVTQELPDDDVFEVLTLLPLLVEDVDVYP